MDSIVREEFERSYWMLTEDSLLLLEASETEANNDLTNSLARASVQCALVLPEVVANCCIDDLALPTQTYKEIDRLSVIAKFDFYLRAKFRAKSLDRGDVNVQALGELKRLRDSYVHPKHRRVAWVGPEDGIQSAIRDVTQYLGIATNPRDWWREDAVLANRAAHAFFKHYFVTCCRYNKSKVASILSSDAKVPEPGNFYTPMFRESIKAHLVRWGIDMSYVKCE
jgi:hypothetical protein